MQSIPNEILLKILNFCLDYGFILRGVCCEWKAVFVENSNPDKFIDACFKEGRKEFVAQIKTDFFTRSRLDFAAENEQLEILEIFKRRGLEFPSSVCSLVAKKGLLKTLEWLVSNGCQWDSGVTYCAAKEGRNSVLKWALEKGCELDVDACCIAAQKGRIEILTLLKTYRLHWDKFICFNAIRGNQLKTLIWAINNDCPLNLKKCIKIAKEEDNNEILEFLLSL